MFKSSLFRYFLFFAIALISVNNASAGTPLEFDDTKRTASGNLTLWEDVGNLNGQSIDVVVRVVSINAGGAVSISTSGDDARTFVQNGTNTGPHEASVRYEFYVANTFTLASGTGTPITIVPFAVFKDIDLASTETAIFDKTNIAQYTVEGGSGASGSESTIVDSDNGTTVTFTSTSSFGTDTRNSVLIDFNPVSSIDVIYTVTSGGRAFNFDGDIDTPFISDDSTKIDVTPPLAPSVDTQSTNDITPTVTGTAEPFSTVSILFGGATFSVITAENGTWSIDTGLAPDSGTFAPDTNGTNDVTAVATDQADNSSAADPSSQEINIDVVAPTLSIANAPAITNSIYTVTFQFSEDVTNFIQSDIDVGNGSASNFTSVDANTYTALITPSSEGVVTIDVASATSQDLAGNNNTAATQVSSIYDVTRPSVSIQNVPNNTNSAFTATFQFSEDVTGFTVASIDTLNANVSDFATVDANTYTALISPVVNGGLTIDVDDSVAQDSATNTNTAATQAVSNFDSVAPSLLIQNAPSETNSAFTVTFQFDEDVTGFDIADIALGNANASNFVQVDANTYTALITPVAQGSVTIDVASSAAQDAAANTSQAATTATVNFDSNNPSVTIQGVPTVSNSAFTTTFQFTEDVIGFSVSDISLGNASATNFVQVDANTYTALITPSDDGLVTIDINASVAQDSAANNNSAATQASSNFDGTKPTIVIQGVPIDTNSAFTSTFQFSEDVTGFTISDISLGNATASDFATVDANTYTALITPTAQGIVTLDVAASIAQDGVSNTNTAAAQVSSNFDTAAPIIIIESAPNESNSAFTVTFQFDEDVTGFDIGDIALGNANASNFVQVDANTYTALITPVAQGSVTIDVASSAAQDAAANTSQAATTATVNFDSNNPSVTIQGVPTVSNSAFTTTFQFTEDVIGFSVSDISRGNASATNFVQVDANTYTALITPSDDGLVTIDINASVAQDSAANNNSAATQASSNFDGTKPTIVIQGVPIDTNSAFTSTFQFSEDVTGFTISDISLGNATASDFATVDANTYTALITPVAQGSVTIDVASSAAQDPAANTSQAATTATVNFDSINPSLIIQDAPTITNSAFTTTFQFSEDVTGFSVSDIDLGNASATNFVQVDANTYTALITPTSDGAVTIDVNASVAQDVSANNNTSANQVSIEFDGTAPTILIQNVPTTTTEAFTAKFTFSENVTNFELSDITVTNANSTDFIQIDAKTYTALITPIETGSVTLNVASNVALDSAANGNVIALQVSTDFDDVLPLVSIATPMIANSNNQSAYTVEGTCNTIDGNVIVAIATTTPSSQSVSCVDSAWSATFDVSTIADGSKVLTISASQTDTAGNIGSVSAQADKDSTGYELTAQNVDAGLNNFPEYSGTSNASDNTMVTIFNANNELLCTAMTKSGVWSCESISALTASSQTLSAKITDQFDNLTVVEFLATITLDSDGDGISDEIEGTADSDGDGIEDYLDTDSDGDGILDAEEGATDTDGDGIPDYLDEDSDGDGILDADEGTADTDGDGTPDYRDPGADEDFDGIPDTIEGTGDTDNDGIADYLDTDSDNDGIPDAVEIVVSGIDSDNDGIDDTFDVDATGGIDNNGDNVDDNVTPRDTDGDGIADYIDVDSDNDGIPDSLEKQLLQKDTDSDGVIDLFDVDITNGIDSDNDSIDDKFDVDFTGGNDFNANGIDDALEFNNDRDGDGIPNYLDIDSDNDGIHDGIEGGAVGFDSSGNGIDDAFDALYTGGVDSNLDGIDDSIVLRDTDGDGVLDLFDLDSDNDSLFDTTEAQILDENNDGLADVNATLFANVIDSDNDGISDAIDTDSNNDGIFDIEDTPSAYLDTNGDGQINFTQDLDGDGIDDSIDINPFSHGDNGEADEDGDGIPFYADADDDNDGIPDVIEGFGDTDGDGIIDSNDRDSDNDGISDALEAQRPLPLGLDDDNDGIDNAYDVDATNGEDVDNDGIDDIFVSIDSDNDGLDDRVDLDSDNDGLSDTFEQILVELSGNDENSNGIDDAVDVLITMGIDANADGVDDSLVKNLDIDLDGLLNYRDIDSDGDGINDDVEGAIDTDSDGIADYEDIDSDNDGISDSKEGANDSDGDGIKDFRDTDSDNDGVSDTEEGDTDTDGDGIDDSKDKDSDNDGILDTDEAGDFNGDGVDDRLQVNEQVKTTLRGAGSNSAGFIAMLSICVFIRRFTNVKLEKNIMKVIEVAFQKMKAIILTVFLAFSFAAKSEVSCIDNKKLDSACWYAAGSTGLSQLNPDENMSGFSTTQDQSAAFKITAGYVLGQHWFSEISYINLGKAELAHANPSLPQNMDIKYSGATISAGYWLFERQNDLNIYIRAGLGAINTKSNFEQYHEKQHSTQIAVGIGAQWRINSNWILRAEIDGLEKDARFIGISIGRFFGESERQYKSPKQTKLPQTSISRVNATNIKADSSESDANLAILPKTPEISSVVSSTANKKNEINDRVNENCFSYVGGEKQVTKNCKTLEKITLNIQFESNSSDLEDRYLAQIKKVSDTISKYKNTVVMVEGHSDSVGSVKENQLLSAQRATAVKEQLLIFTKGNEADFEAIGKGELFPIADNDNDKVRHKNRRVEITIYSKVI